MSTSAESVKGCLSDDLHCLTGEPTAKHRELPEDIARLIADGASNPEIAQQLVIGISTVKKHINHIFSKLGVESRTQALVRARELNLL